MNLLSDRAAARWPRGFKNLFRPPSGLWRYVVALAIVAVTTLVAEGFYRVFDTTRLSMVFLAGVLITTVTLGANPGYFAALLAFFIYNFYLVEPRFTFQLVSAEDVIVLVVFLTVAMLTGGLAGRMRDEALRNKAHAHTTNALFHASRELSSADEEEAIRGRIVHHIADAAAADAMIWDGRQTWSSPAFLKIPEDLIEETRTLDPSLTSDEPWVLAGGRWRGRPLRADGVDLGVAVWRLDGGRVSDPDGDRLINILVDLGAAAIMRARLGVQRSEVQALARTEQLRNALLSSISHDLRTPLAAILASASSLKDFGDRFAPEVRIDLVTTIQEEAERLNRFVANLLSMTRLESGALDLEPQTFDVIEVLNRVVDRQARAGPSIGRDFITWPLMIAGDPILLEQALGNILENAAHHSPGPGTIMVRARRREDVAVIEIEDAGPGVAAAELERIFEKFYRSASTAAAAQGTGLGLSISKGLIEAMNGAISASVRPDGEPGLLIEVVFNRSLEHGS